MILEGKKTILYGVLRIPGHPLDLSIGGRRRYPQDTAVHPQDTIGILEIRGIPRTPPVSWGYADILWGCHRCPEDTGSF